MSSLSIKKENYVLKDLFDEYINECVFIRGLRPATTEGFKYVFGLFQRLTPEAKYLDELNTQVLITFFTRLQTRERPVGANSAMKGVKNSTIHTYARKLKSFFKWLQQKEYVKINPLNGVQFALTEYTDDRALENREIEKIITAIYTHSTSLFSLKRDLAIIHVLVLCGVRKGELLGLRVQDVDFSNKVITVRKETSKSKTTRLLPMNSRLALILKDYLLERKKLRSVAPELFLSSRSKLGLSKHGMKYWVNRLVRLSKVKFHLHRFRHTFACGLEKRNVTPTKIQKLMGHKDITMTTKYLRSTHAEDLRDEINSLCIDDML